MTTKECVYELLKAGWTSRVDALREAGTLELPKRVSEFRQAGIVVESRKIKAVNRFGKTIARTEYRIKEESK